MDTSDFKVGAFFTDDGKEIWKLTSCCLAPTCELKNLETGEVKSFGMNGITAQNFHRILMPGKAVIGKVS